MPYHWRVQWLYPVYRCTLSSYFLVWQVYNISNACFYGTLERHFSFLTNWSFLLWNLYLFVSAVNVTINQLCHHRCRHTKAAMPRKLCCTCGQDRSTLCDKISWLLFTVSTESAVTVTVLYWAILSSSEESPLTSPANLHVHLLNGIVAVGDLWVSGIPVHLFHFLYTFLYVSCYVAFTGVHYATNTTGTSEGHEYLYPVLDYGAQPGLSAGLVIGVVLGFLPLLHILFIAQYLARTWITTRMHNKVGIYRKFSPTSAPTQGEPRFNVDDGESSEMETTFTTADDDC